jgi:hypothetical protein
MGSMRSTHHHSMALSTLSRRPSVSIPAANTEGSGLSNCGKISASTLQAKNIAASQAPAIRVAHPLDRPNGTVKLIRLFANHPAKTRTRCS